MVNPAKPPSPAYQAAAAEGNLQLLLPAAPWYRLVQTKTAPTCTLIEILPASACRSNVGSKKKKSGKYL